MVRLGKGGGESHDCKNYGILVSLYNNDSVNIIIYDKDATCMHVCLF